MGVFGDYLKPFNNCGAQDILMNRYLLKIVNMAKQEDDEIQQKVFWKHFNWMKKHIKEYNQIQETGICRCGRELRGHSIIDRGYEFGFECRSCM